MRVGAVMAHALNWRVIVMRCLTAPTVQMNWIAPLQEKTSVLKMREKGRFGRDQTHSPQASQEMILMKFLNLGQHGNLAIVLKKSSTVTMENVSP